MYLGAECKPFLQSTPGPGAAAVAKTGAGNRMNGGDSPLHGPMPLRKGKLMG
jgi:hypothetical protein